jgi:hypothetical protein
MKLKWTRFAELRYVFAVKRPRERRTKEPLAPLSVAHTSNMRSLRNITSLSLWSADEVSETSVRVFFFFSYKSNVSLLDSNETFNETRASTKR